MRYVELFRNRHTNHKIIPASENINSFCAVSETLQRQHRGKRLSGFCSCFDISYWNRKVGWDISRDLSNIYSLTSLASSHWFTSQLRGVMWSFQKAFYWTKTRKMMLSTILIWFPEEKDSLKTSTVKGKRDVRALLKQIATRFNNVNMQINDDTLMGLSLHV